LPVIAAGRFRAPIATPGTHLKEKDMAVTDRTPALPQDPMSPDRRTARVAGVIYLLTFVSIPTLALYAPVHETGFVLGPGPDIPVLLGAVLEMVVALACIGTAVVLYPVLKRQGEAVALGFVGVRVLEAATILTGIAALLAVVSLRRAGAGPEAVVVAQALVAVHDWMFLLGQGFLPAINALLLGCLLYRARLVPRVLPVIGLIGAPLLTASAAATLFDLWGQVSALAGLAALPIAVWEFSLGVWLVARGFTPARDRALVEEPRPAR